MEDAREREIREARSVSDGLRKTRESMLREIERSRETMTVLERSSETIGQIHAEYGSFESVLQRGKGLLTRIMAQDRTDLMVIGAALAFFLLVVAYVVNKRLPLKVQHVFWLLVLVTRSFRLSMRGTFAVCRWIPGLARRAAAKFAA